MNPALEPWIVLLCQRGYILRDELGDDAQALCSWLDQQQLRWHTSRHRILLETKLQLLELATIEAALAVAGRTAYPLLYQQVSQSTNADVLRHYEQYQQPSIALCEMQTAGKGRHGRQWLSPFGQNIYCTIGMEKHMPSAQIGLLSIISGITLCQALADCGIDQIQIKWPNDLYYQQHKLGGILIESKPAPGGGYFFAIGFGLNVQMQQALLDQIPQAATCIPQPGSVAVTRDQILAVAIPAIIEKIDRFQSTDSPELIAAFAARDAFYDQTICVLQADKKTLGLNAGINHNGQLMLETDQGLQAFSAAEISMRVAQHATD